MELGGEGNWEENSLYLVNIWQCSTSWKEAGSIPVYSLEFFFDVFPPTAPWYWGEISLQQNE